MYISKLSITNFRNFRNSNFSFKKGINTLIGENGSGKTNAFYALRLMIDGNLPINASKLIETDFNKGLSDWRGHWISIKLEFKDLDSSEATTMLAHKLENVLEEGSKGTYIMYFRPNKKIRKVLYELTQSLDKNAEALEVILSNITINDYETVYCFRGNADLTDELVYKKIVGDFENIEYPDPDKDDLNELGNPTSQTFLIRNEIACTFIKALRNVVSDLKQIKQSPLLNLLRGTANEIKVKDSESITSKVVELNTSISELEEIKRLTNKVKSSLNDTLGFTYAPSVNIKSELPEEINKLLASLTLWVGDGEEDQEGKLEDLSLGGANLIYITLKLLEYEYKQPDEEKVAHFLLIEEPEAHIHTHIQKTLFDKYQFMNTQIIASTHSTHISSASRISAVNILSKDKNRTYVCNPSKSLLANECIRIERYLDATRSTLLFAKGVILVEGDAELILIPEMFKRVFGVSLDEIGVSIINMSSTVFEHIAKLFHDERIHRRCSVITDNDISLIDLPEDSSKDNKQQKKARDSQTKGIERRSNLDTVYKDNQWVRPFYAKHTFEVDFILSGNKDEIISILDKIYKRDVDRESSRLKLASDNSQIKGLEILRLAEKEGKGWFALLIAEGLSLKTLIPTYILEAIAFTSSHITTKHFIKMAKHIIKNKLYDSSSAFEEIIEKGNVGALEEDEILAEILLTLNKVDSENQLSGFYEMVIKERKLQYAE
ncbi:ATP-dependent endonuclease [Paenibacillus xylanexedens]|uniref:ATP-dependent nuclease n=1 Tax=Paenibacillus xylanexedens TaxID=528191 RepID=UPI001C8E7659|nr:AAA family ATPase [Paenibacillus xylanexedens]MBY0117730.1 AAA family ATPase [Paenibacillus xylanexedens]